MLVSDNLGGDISYGLEGGDEVTGSPASRAWVVHDGTHLLIGVDKPGQPNPTTATGQRLGY